MDCTVLWFILKTFILLTQGGAITVSMSPKVKCEGAKRPSGGGGGGGWEGRVPPPREEKILHLEPETTISDSYLWQRLLKYDLFQIAVSVSDTFVMIIIERAKRASASGNGPYFQVNCEENCEEAKRPSGGVWEGVSLLPGQRKLCIWSPKNPSF